jgi:hypothetical protein
MVLSGGRQLHYQDSEATRSVIASPDVHSRPTGDSLARPAELQATAEGDAEGARPLLDLRTQLVSPSRRPIQTTGWKFTFWPGCSEASLVIVTSGSTRFRGDGDRPPLSEEAAALHWQIANGRAGTKSRRYFVVNQLRYMWVLTYPGEGQYDRSTVMSEVSEFARRLRIVRNGENFPYWYSPELHPGGHGWHVNFFIPFRIAHSQIEGLWDRGWVWVVDYGTAYTAQRENRSGSVAPRAMDTVARLTTAASTPRRTGHPSTLARRTTATKSGRASLPRRSLSGFKTLSRLKHWSRTSCRWKNAGTSSAGTPTTSRNGSGHRSGPGDGKHRLRRNHPA